MHYNIINGNKKETCHVGEELQSVRNSNIEEEGCGEGHKIRTKMKYRKPD